MRVAVLCSDLGIRLPGDKGASLHVMAVAKALTGAGHDVAVIGVAGNGPSPFDRSLLIPHPGRSEGLRREIRKLRFVAGLPVAAAAFLDEFQPDVLYERLSLFGTAGAVIARRLGIPHIVEVNALLAEEDAAWRGLTLVRTAHRRQRSVLTGADRVVAVSDELAARIEDVRRGSVEVVPNGFDADLFSVRHDRNEARARFGLPDAGPIMIFTGALRPWHGLAVAIEALALLPQATLVVVGDGPVRQELEERGRLLGVGDRVHWLGRLPHQAVPRALAVADVALAPYPELDGFVFSPLKVYEYLAAGVPVVASAIGQLIDLVGPWGRLAVPGDAQSLAHEVAAMLSDSSASARAEAARSWAMTHHSWHERAERLTVIMEAVTGRAMAV